MGHQGEHWVELRVHGVSGAPAEDMLDSAHVVQVAGDEFSRFFRPCDAQRRETHPSDDHVMEVYHWGKYTSGSWRQGLWLTILPFGVVNAAQFLLALPTTRLAKVSHALCGAMLRLLGLGLTAMLLLSVAVGAMDLTAAQWGPTHNLPVWDRAPGWPLVVAMLLCVGVLSMLFSFGRRFAGTSRVRSRAMRRLDGRSPAGPDQPGAPESPPTELGRREFFSGDTDAPTLRRLHLATGLALIAMMGAAAGRGSSQAGAVLSWTFWVAVVLLGVTTTIVVLLGDPEESVTVHTVGRLESRRVWWHKRVHALALALVIVAGLVLVVSLWQAGGRTLTVAASRRALPGIDGASVGVLVACVVAMFGLLAANWVLAAVTTMGAEPGRPASFSRFAAGMAPTLAASVGTFLGVGYAAALPFGWAWFLGRGEGQGYEVSPLLQRIAYAWGLTLVLVIGIIAAAGISYAVRRDAFRNAAVRAFTFGASSEPRLSVTWISRVGTAMWLARLKNSLEALLWTLSVFGLVLTLAATLEFLRLGRGGQTRDLPGPLGLLSEEPSAGAPKVLIAAGTVVLIGLAVGLVLLGRGAIRKESLRRGVNVGWDVMAFWPRAVHPFVPPPYSQRAVADLRSRISWHLAGQSGPTMPRSPASSVVVAAHSQGSLIAVAALLWLPAEERSRVGLLTFGSQLKVQFPRAFPAYVNFDVLRWLFEKYEGRWVNMYRDTDAIAGPVLSWNHNAVTGGGTPQSKRIDAYDSRQDDVIDFETGARICGNEWRVLDPTPYDPDLNEGAVARIAAHGTYWRDPDWPNAIASVRPIPDPEHPGAGSADADPAAVLADPRHGMRQITRRQFEHGLSPPFNGGRTQR